MTFIELMLYAVSAMVILIVGLIVLFLTVRLVTFAYFTAKDQARRYTTKNKRIKEDNEKED